MRITHVAAEFSPFAQAGGLGIAVSGLTKSLANKEHSIETIIPYYQSLNLTNSGFGQNCKKSKFSIYDGVNTLNIEAYEFLYNKIQLTFLKFPLNNNPFARDSIYGYEDDQKRFILFCLAVQNYLNTKPIPDIVHLHDWHTGLLALLLRKYSCKTVLTIHNFAYQGVLSKEIDDYFDISKKLNEANLEKKDSSSLLKIGLCCVDRVTTVSPTYAKEILSDPSNREMFAHFGFQFTGILNGIDFDYWNPGTDPLITSKYSLTEFQKNKTLLKEARKSNRLLLSKETGMTQSERPLFGIVSRLTEQKGLAFIKTAILKTQEYNYQLIVMGSCSDPIIEKEFYNLKKTLEKTGRISINLCYNERIAHLIYASSDAILVPSLFEPCGLSQLIAMRYGAIPVVTQTGGLLDTVKPKVNGFTFKPSEENFVQTLQSAINMKINNSIQWEKMIQNGMKKNSDWKASVSQYCELYKELLITRTSDFFRNYEVPSKVKTNNCD